MPLDGFQEYSREDAERYNRRRWWPGLTWGDIFDKATDLYPRKIGLVDDTQRFTYRELRERVDRLAISFLELDVGQGDFALVQLPNWHEFIISYFALQKIGVRVVLLIARHGKAEINYLCELTKPTLWILPDKYGKIDYNPLVADICKGHASLRHIIFARSKERKGLPLETLIDRGNITAANLKLLEQRRPDPMEVATITPTGGTTGLPKAVPRIHNDFIANVEYHSKAWEITSADTVLTSAPVSHGQGMLCGLGASFFNYATYVLTDSTKAEDICTVIERERVTAFPTVPAVLRRIVNLENLGKYDLSSLKKVYSGGAPSGPELVKAVGEKLGCRFVNAYGSAEGSCAMTRLDDDLETACTSVGRKDCPYNEFKVINQYGEEVPPGAEGELVTKGPTIFTGYFKSEEENKKIFTGDGFFKTGDLARIDESGTITLTGRIKETILRGGETISAVGIERLICAYPGVADVAVIGMPDKDLGERVCAYVVTKAGETLTFEQVIAFLRGEGASVMQLPERIEFVEEIPLTKIGKADKKMLKEDIVKKLAGCLK
jgi:2,3-dihydroxybenzoate-AMP ligase/mycobactin salicyl-AMP ligase